MTVPSDHHDPGLSAPRDPTSTLPDELEVAEAAHPAVGAVFWVAVVGGAILVAVGLRGLVASHVTWLFSMAAWFVLGGVLIDLALIPLVALIGLGGRAVLPEWAWRVVRVGFVITALLVAFSLVPIVQPNGHSANTTVLPRDYGRGLLVYLVIVWVLVAAGLLASWFVDRGAPTATPPVGQESGAEALG